MHNDVKFSDRSALTTTTAGLDAGHDRGPGARPVNRHGRRQDNAKSGAQGRLGEPPFSWLGGDAWPSFSVGADA